MSEKIKNKNVVALKEIEQLLSWVKYVVIVNTFFKTKFKIAELSSILSRSIHKSIILIYVTCTTKEKVFYSTNAFIWRLCDKYIPLQCRSYHKKKDATVVFSIAYLYIELHHYLQIAFFDRVFEHTH